MMKIRIHTNIRLFLCCANTTLLEDSAVSPAMDLEIVHFEIMTTERSSLFRRDYLDYA